MSPITSNLSLFANSAATCGSGSSREVPTSVEDHKWFTEFYSIDSYRTFRRLLRPEAHVSIRYDTAQIAITGLHCHFWLMCNQPAFTCHRSRPIRKLHLSILRVSFSLAVWGCQVHPCIALFSELCTNPLPEMHIRVGTF
jgi:hypothetical protein